MTEWTWEDFGPGKSGEQFIVLAERLAIWGYPLSAKTTLWELTQKFQLEVMKVTGTQPGGNADGWVGPGTWRKLMTDPIVTMPPVGTRVSTDLWKLTTPVWADEDKESPLEIYPISADFEMEPWFERTSTGSIIFRANAGGAHTENSLKARSELREMNKDGSKAAWDTADGRLHVMEGACRILQWADKIPSMVIGQCHDPYDDVFMLNAIANADRRYAQLILLESLGPGKGSIKHLIASSHRIADPIEYRMEFDREGFRLLYKGYEVKEIPGEWDKCYWKAGVYPQTDVSKGELPSSISAVEYPALQAFHR